MRPELVGPLVATVPEKVPPRGPTTWPPLALPPDLIPPLPPDAPPTPHDASHGAANAVGAATMRAIRGAPMQTATNLWVAFFIDFSLSAREGRVRQPDHGCQNSPLAPLCQHFRSIRHQKELLN